MTMQPHEWRAKQRGVPGLPRRLPATGAHISTSDRRVLGPESRVPALGSKDRCRAILKNRETRRSSPRRPCGCRYPLVRCCSSRLDKTLSWVSSSTFRAAREYVKGCRLAIGPFVPLVTQHYRSSPLQIAATEPNSSWQRQSIQLLTTPTALATFESRP
jgi:hypothetical protein